VSSNNAKNEEKKINKMHTIHNKHNVMHVYWRETLNITGMCCGWATRTCDAPHHQRKDEHQQCIMTDKANNYNTKHVEKVRCNDGDISFDAP
jgi:hypothetical protein